MFTLTLPPPQPERPVKIAGSCQIYQALACSSWLQQALAGSNRLLLAPSHFPFYFNSILASQSPLEPARASQSLLEPARARQSQFEQLQVVAKLFPECFYIQRYIIGPKQRSAAPPPCIRYRCEVTPLFNGMSVTLLLGSCVVRS